MAKNVKQQQDFLPTPPIGYRVLWRECGGRNVKPADVMGQNPGEPGILALSINHGPRLQYMEAVHWENHPGADVSTKNTQFRGTWAYMPGEAVPEQHYAVHMDMIEQTEVNRKNQLEWIEEQKRLNEEAQSQPVDPLHLAVATAQAAAILQSQGT